MGSQSSKHSKLTVSQLNDLSRLTGLPESHIAQYHQLYSMRHQASFTRGEYQKMIGREELTELDNWLYDYMTSDGVAFEDVLKQVAMPKYRLRSHAWKNIFGEKDKQEERFVNVGKRKKEDIRKFLEIVYADLSEEEKGSLPEDEKTLDAALKKIFEDNDEISWKEFLALKQT